MIERFKSYALTSPSPGTTSWILSRLALVLPGVMISVAALAAPSLRHADGWLLPEAWIMAVAGVGLALAGITFQTRWQRFAGVSSLALIGQASALGIIDAPNYTILQHFYSWGDILGSNKALMLLAPVAQAAVLAYVGWRFRAVILASSKRLLSKAQVVVLAGVVIFGLANGSFDVLRFGGEVVLAGWIVLLSVVNLILVAVTIPQDALESIWSWLKSRFMPLSDSEYATLSLWDRALPWAVAAWVVAVSATLAWVVFDRVPHIPDGVSYLFQAKYLSTGSIFLPTPPEAAAFDFEKFHNDGTRFWAYGFPGWPATLSIGVRLGIPWLVNPLLAGLTLLLTHSLVSRLYNRSLAHIVVLLLAVSPWFLFMSASFMPHPLTIVWTLIALLAIDKARNSKPILWGLLAGASLGALLLTRPLEGVAVSAAIGAWLLWRHRRQALRPMIGLAVGGIMIGGLIFPYNASLTGSPLVTPHQVMTDSRYYPGADRIGFGDEVGTYGWRHIDPLPGHGPADVVLNAHMNYYMVNFELFGWAFGSVGLVALLLIWKRVNNQDLLFVLIIAIVVAGHSFFWFSGGPDFGARYWYQLLIPLVVLTARGIQEAQRRWIETGGAPIGTLRIGAFVAAAGLIALVTFVPWRGLEKYHDYRGINADMAALAETYNFGDALVFVRSNIPEDYARALVFNPTTFDSEGTIYVQDLGEESRERLMQHFSNRNAWIVERDGGYAAPFRVVEGSISSN